MFLSKEDSSLKSSQQQDGVINTTGISIRTMSIAAIAAKIAINAKFFVVNNFFIQFHLLSENLIYYLYRAREEAPGKVQVLFMRLLIS